ncbi:MAG TPA: hypothetical protein VIN63_08460 [Candidatus Limnocylindria bacterium]|jgi:hypothetical protein
MKDVAVHFAPNGTDADVAASALRAAGLHPRIALDTTFGLAAGLTSNSGRRVIFVPATEEGEAREVLQEPRLEEPEDNPVLRMVVIVALIVGLLLATPFVAQACSGA